jgi:hypothetical protein
MASRARSLLLVLVATVGCASKEEELAPADATAADGTEGGGTFDLEAGGGECTSAAQCDGGVCIDGRCCSSVEAVCGASCCSGESVCLFGACVVPGKSCTTTNDCGAGAYCETALGTTTASDAGVDANVDGSETSATCSEPPPRSGRCVPRPTVCPEGDAGVDAGACLARCEYRPPPAGPLNAIAEWSWGTGTAARQFPNFIDVWSTPTVARIHDANCDGKVDELDPPNVVFVAGNVENTCCQCNGKTPTACHTGVLRMLNGRTGAEVWSLRRASPESAGFAGVSTAVGDVTGDGRVDVVAVTGEGRVVVVDGTGSVVHVSDQPIPGADDGTFGWGGGLALADADGDGFAEIAYGSTLFSMKGGTLKRVFGTTPSGNTALATFADLDGAAGGNLELLTGPKAFRVDGTVLWDRTAEIASGFPAVGDMDGDGDPDVALVHAGKAWILEGRTGATILGPIAIPGTGSGGPPTIADFDGDGKPEIGVAMQNQYSVLKPDLDKKTLAVLWSAPNHDLSSSVTGSSVFDFEGDGRAEVIYNDECFLWVYDGPTGKVRFAALTTSFTATEASIVADVDGDGRAEIVMVSNRVDPSDKGWKCDIAPWNQPDPAVGRPAWKPPASGPSYGGITVFGDAAGAWVGTRTLWSQHTYHVTEICDDRDSACLPGSAYGSIPRREQKNWRLPWLNNFRQNVQDRGIFDAPDATVALEVRCSSPAQLEASLRNGGLATLPSGVEIAFVNETRGNAIVGRARSTRPLFPGQTEVISFVVPEASGGRDDVYKARIVVDPTKPTFPQCRTDNDESPSTRSSCPR